MPKWSDLASGRDAENTRTQELVEALHKRGIPSAAFERIFTVRKESRETPSKPDISFTNGGVHIISAKWGEAKELKSITSAAEYKEDLGPALRRTGAELGEVFALTYPASRSEKFILHVLPREGRKELSLRLDSLEEVADRIVETVHGLVRELEKRQEPILQEARRLLPRGARELAAAMEKVDEVQLQSIFGGHDFFDSLLRPRLKGSAKNEALRLGAAYLFVNQVLFYVLLSQAASERGGEISRTYPRIAPEHFSNPSTLRSEYFERVHAKNYEPIYGFDLARFFHGAAAEEACNDLVRGIEGLAPKLDVPDLVGQVFQSLIPFEIRKPLGANYTNPHAAALLARLAVRKWSDTALDPACGSGTLLVATYKRKMSLAPAGRDADLHHEFLEKQITGIDAMGFAAHLAAVNLALQAPLVETDHVRIGLADSTTKRPGGLLDTTEITLPRELRQSRLDSEFGRSRRGKGSRLVRLTSKPPRPIPLTSVDLVIMNPPFTSWDNMGESYRDSLSKSFSNISPDYRKAIYWKISQQAFFLLLADLFLNEEGRVAAVLPVTTLTGQAFSPLLSYLLAHYTVNYIVIGMGRQSFSEDTSFSECMVVATKSPPSPDSTFVLIGTETSPELWSTDDVDRIARAAESRRSIPELARIAECKQKELESGNESILGLTFRLRPEYDSGMKSLERLRATSHTPWVPFASLGVEMNRYVLGGGWLAHYGSQALFGYRGEKRALKSTDRLIIDRVEKGNIVLRDRIGGHEYSFPLSATSPAMRRIAYQHSMDVTGDSDVVVVRNQGSLADVFEAMYGAKDAKVFLGRFSRAVRSSGGGRWESMVNRGKTRLALHGRLNLSAPGTTLLAVRSDIPFLLAGHGWMLRGIGDPRVERFLCLWFNSTPFILGLMGKLSLTEGTWVGLEKYVIEPSLIPNASQFTDSQWATIERVYAEVKDGPWGSLMEQLDESKARTTLDLGMMEICGGVPLPEREKACRAMQFGLQRCLSSLRESMGRGTAADSDE